MYILTLAELKFMKSLLVFTLDRVPKYSIQYLLDLHQLIK